MRLDALRMDWEGVSIKLANGNDLERQRTRRRANRDFIADALAQQSASQWAFIRDAPLAWISLG